MGKENHTLVSLFMGHTLGSPTDRDIIFHLTVRPSEAHLCVSMKLYMVKGVTFEILYKDNIELGCL